MMDTANIPADYILAEGPEGLSQVLDGLLIKYEQGAKDVPYYVLYKLGGQQSLIKVDISKKPFQFWYCDLLGRPATRTVKETIARFLWEKCGEKERYAEED